MIFGGEGMGKSFKEKEGKGALRVETLEFGDKTGTTYGDEEVGTDFGEGCFAFDDYGGVSQETVVSEEEGLALNCEVDGGGAWGDGRVGGIEHREEGREEEGIFLTSVRNEGPRLFHRGSVGGGRRRMSIFFWRGGGEGRRIVRGLL